MPVDTMKTQDVLPLVCFGILVLVEGTQQGLPDAPSVGCMPFGPRDCDPCAKASCPDFDNVPTRCENRRCKTCRAAFFQGGKEIKSCCNSDERCKDGTRKFHCYTNPCHLATCPAVANADCRPNYCGGCKPEFFWSGTDRKISDGFCIREKCPEHLPRARCAVDQKCMGETCPLVPGADCWIDGCNAACAVIFYKGLKRLSREDCHGCPMNDRVPGCGNPCDGAACPMYPNARCEPQTCGKCKANFYGLDRKLIKDCIIDPGFSPPCPDGSQPFNCLVDPCTVNSCPGVPDSVCRANYCGGCKAEFFTSGVKLTDSQCNLQEPCPGDVPVAVCMDGICDSKNCPMYRYAECFIDGCNGCNAIFHKDGNRLTREDCVGCPHGKPKMDCGDICANAHCPLYPEARCEPRVCGECGAVFFGLDRKRIKDCCRAGCPPGVDEHMCKVNPCDTASCPRKPLAQCKPNYCGACKAEFYILNTKLTDMQCIKNPKPKITCKVPSRIKNGRTSPDDKSFVNEGEYVYYKCVNGFVLRGKSMRKCVRKGNMGRLFGLTPTCIGVNLCKKRPCNANANCRNAKGSFTCTCKPGYSGDGKKCYKKVPSCPKNSLNPLLGTKCIDRCNSDADCKSATTCCHDARCGKVCRQTSVPSCPAEYWTPYVGVKCVDQCKSDTDCAPSEACCFDGCGKICRQSWYV